MSSSKKYLLPLLLFVFIASGCAGSKQVLKFSPKKVSEYSEDQIIWKPDKALPPAPQSLASAYDNLQEFNFPNGVDGVALSPDGSRILAGSYEGRVKIWNTRNGKQLLSLQVDNFVDAAFVSGEFRVFTSKNREIVRMIDPYNKTILQTFPMGSLGMDVAVSENEKYLLIGGYNGIAKVWNLQTFDLLHTFPHESWINAVDIASDNQRALTASQGQKAKIWDLTSGDHLRTLKHKNRVLDADFSPEGDRILTGTLHKAQLWNAKNGQLIKELNHLTGPDGGMVFPNVSSVAFSPHGRKIITGTNHGVARIWKLNSGNIEEMLIYNEAVEDVTYSRDGKNLVTASDTGSVHFWQTPKGFGLLKTLTREQLNYWKKRELQLPEELLKKRKRLQARRKKLQNKSFTKPEPIKVKCGQYVTQKQCQKRKEEAKQTYQEKLDAHRRKVEKHNEKVETLNRKMDRMKNRILQYKKDKVGELTPELLHRNFLKVFGKPQFSDIRYDASSQTYFLDIVSHPDWPGDFRETIAFQKRIDSKKEGKRFQEKLKQSSPVVKFDISGNSLQWDTAWVDINQERYAMIPTNQDYQFKAFETKIATKKSSSVGLEKADPVSIEGNQQPNVDLELSNNPEIAKLQKQLQQKREKLKEEQQEKARKEKLRNQLESIQQKLSRKKDRQYQDDLPGLIKRAESVPVKENRYLFAVGIRNYSSAPDVPFSKRSTKLFKKVAHKKLGIVKDSEHMMVLTGEKATGTRLQGYLSTFLNRLDSNDKLYFYYAGHGVPGRNKNAAYVLPRDAVKGAYQNAEFRIGKLYEKLDESEAEEVVAFLDACFSGQASKDEMIFDGVAPAGRMMRGSFESKIPESLTVVTAGTNSQFSNAYQQRGHRLFSYYLIKGLLKSKNGESFLQYVKQKVKERSEKLGPDYRQTPQIYGDVDLSLRN